MDVVKNILGGLQSGTIASVLSAFLSVSLYVTYLFVNYSATNVPSKLLMPSYDFIIVGGGSAGMFFRYHRHKFYDKPNNCVTETNITVRLHGRKNNSICYVV